MQMQRGRRAALRRASNELTEKRRELAALYRAYPLDEARANSLIAATRWANIDLKSLVEEELGAFRMGQVKISGDAIDLQPPSAQHFGMIVHELATNAVKHGALSTRRGTVVISWSLDDEELCFVWEENGGPPTKDPMRSNTGNAVIAATARLLRGRIVREWRPEGLRVTLHCQADAL